LERDVRKGFLKRIVAALAKAIEQAERKPANKEEADEMPTAPELLDARYVLTYFYLISGDPYRAAVLGEDLARMRPINRKSALAAAYALEAYNQIAARTNDAFDREQMMRLSRFIETDKAWENDPLSSFARYQRAMLLSRDKNHLVEALELLEQLPPSFKEYLYSQCQIVLFAAQGERDKELSDEQREVLRKKAKTALQ